MKPHEVALEKLRQAQGEPDCEMAHEDADLALCEMLTALGYDEVVAAWKRVDKWYA